MGSEARRAMEACGEQLVAAVDVLPVNAACPRYRDISEVKEGADVILDFSRADVTERVVRFALDRRVPAVIAATGQGDGARALIRRAAQDIPIFFCGNLSFGAALFSSLVGRVAAAFPYADAEIIETHHAAKADAPSGTALMLADSIISARGMGRVVVGARSCRKPGDVGISSLRLGERAGVHEVIFDTGLQQISLRHEAFGRELFARGAINAMRFLQGKPAGLYGINDILAMRLDGGRQ